MRRGLILAIILAGVFVTKLQAQSHAVRINGGKVTGREIIDGEINYKVEINPVVIHGRPTDMRKYARLVRNVKIVYPYAKEAGEYMRRLDTELQKLKTNREKDKYTKR